MRKIKEGVVNHTDLVFYTDYFKSFDDKHYIIQVQTKRGDQYIARMIDEDGDDWYIIKQMFNNRYKRLKKDSVTRFEVQELK